MRLTLLSFLALATAACSTIEQPARMIQQPTLEWRQVASREDRARLRDWRKAFAGAVGAARLSGHGSEIAREGPLLEPDSALGGGPIPNGTYRCRMIKLGAKTEGLLNYVSYPAFTCRIEPKNGLQEFAKLTGSQRPVGLIFPGDAMRQIFLGTLVLGDEQGAMQYGQDETRNVAGFVERVGSNRWRLVMPRPHFESQTDVMELVPA
jgi:hypothetical protein